jgi:hypothetical protein
MTRIYIGKVLNTEVFVRGGEIDWVQVRAFREERKARLEARRLERDHAAMGPAATPENQGGEGRE